jgi:predicted ATP-dependent Lon-type protease
MILKFKDIKNEIRFILHKWDKEERNPVVHIVHENVIQQNNRQKIREQNRLTYLCEVKEKLKVELNDYRGAYSNMDEIFIREIKHAETQTNRLGIWLLCLWRRNTSYNGLKNINPVLDKYFRFLFVDE